MNTSLAAWALAAAMALVCAVATPAEDPVAEASISFCLR